jgi:hypothetical protein
LWALRFTREEDDEVRYRVLCASRNLTFDRSWDTLLSLDGVYTQRTNAFAENHPLADFVAGLPSLATTPMDAKKRASVENIADELRRVKFELPGQVEALRFHPMGLTSRAASPFEERIGRLLVVSPFVTEGALKRLARPGRNDVLVSRADQLAELPGNALASFASVRILDSAAELEDEDHEGMGPANVDTVASGLHAKLYVADDGWKAHVWTGSTNATTAGFERNVEFLVQLTGKKSALGVDAFLEGHDGRGGIAALLANFVPPPRPEFPTETQRRLEQQLSTLRTVLGRARWCVVVGAEQEQRFPLALECRSVVELPAGASVKCWPITLHENRAQLLNAPLRDQVADFGLCSFEAITAFFAFAVHVAEGDTALDTVFVVNATIEGAPYDRNGRILRSLLDSPAKVLRFVHLLLNHDEVDISEGAESFAAQRAGAGNGNEASEPPMLEALLRALDRSPGAIDAVARMVRDLREGQSGTEPLPPGFAEVWDPIWAARSGESRGGRK